MKDKTSIEISDYIFEEYINGFNLDVQDRVSSKLPLLVDNNLACAIRTNESVYYAGAKYMVTSKFIQKFNKDLKKYRRKLYTFEFGGEGNKIASSDKKINDLVKYVLEDGTYYVMLDDKNYCSLVLKTEPNSQSTVESIIYFIGKDWKKWKNKYYKYLDKYEKYCKNDEEETINYTNGKPSTTAIFKPFDQIIFKDKEKVLKYIDNWIQNIPVYYNKYHMISKLSILLYGNVGTGKSTFAKAVAKYLELTEVTSVTPDYFAIDNSEKSGDTRRYRMPAETIFTIDDIDCVCQSREENQSKENSEVMANLLTFLDNPPTFYFKAKDGVRYPVAIVIATTNYIDRLDPAVKRYGRFDLKIEMKDFDKEDAQKMCDIYDLQLKDIVLDMDVDAEDFTISPSYLQAKCLENLDKSMKKVE